MDSTYWKSNHKVSVGIMETQMLHFILHGNYLVAGKTATGPQQASYVDGTVRWGETEVKELTFQAQDADSTFSLEDVTIGKQYHWQRQEEQTFSGDLHLLAADGQLHAINYIDIESYLLSVISSEMKATASLEFLKASAIISRSWLLKQIEQRMHPASTDDFSSQKVDTPSMLITWSNRQDHQLFDVCADDHCQRYQGLTKASNPHVAQAIEETRGQVLVSQGEICDARFAKSCGGISEEYGTCWEDRQVSYLSAVSDTWPEAQSLPDLTQETEAEKWILSNPPALCNTSDKAVLSQVLNDYDLETQDFYRWKVSYTQTELSQLIRRKTGIDHGDIIDLVPLKRGKSGRICQIRVVGSRCTRNYGKELEIRRILSETHLYSSAFVIRKGESVDGVPQTFALQGAGWGHGVGMCQIGAAVMGSQGYSYRQILLHYYKGAEIEKLY